MSLYAAARSLSTDDVTARDAAMSALLKGRTSSIAPLVEVLSEPGAAIGRLALLLSALGAREGIQALVKLVEGATLASDERPFVAQALAELLTADDENNPAAGRAVQTLSRASDAATRRFAAAALGALGSSAAQKRLRELGSHDLDPSVQRAALEALVALKAGGRLLELKSKPETAPAEMKADPSEAKADAEIEEGGLAIDFEQLLAAQGSSSSAADGGDANDDGAPVSFSDLVAQANEEGGQLKPWLDQLGAPRWSDRTAAVEVLVKAGRCAVPHLIERLSHPEVGMRTGASMALMRLQAPEAAYALLMCATAPAVTDEEKDLRPIALKALANSLTGAEEGLADALIPLARDSDRWVRAGALLCLGRISDHVGTRVAVLALDDQDPIVRDAAAVAVSEGAREDDNDLILPLLAIFGGFPSPSPEVTEAILIALSRIRSDDEAIKVRLRRRVRRSIFGQTSAMRRTALSILERSWSEADPPPVTVIDDVLTRLADSHPEVRVLAASFVAVHLEPGMCGAVATLTAAVEEKEGTIALLCLDALRRHGTAEAEAALIAAAASTDEAVAMRAAEILDAFVVSVETWRFTKPVKASPPAAEKTLIAKLTAEREESATRLAEDRARTTSKGAAAANPPVVVDAVIPEVPAFTDDPSQSLVERLRAVRDAGGSGRLSAKETARSRQAVLMSFAADSGDEGGEQAG